MNPEKIRLEEAAQRKKNWKRWGPYLAERQWGTVREDYSADGNAWDYFQHDYARSRAYRWGEDGLMGITDRECRLCFSIALWNGKDDILKERLFGLSGHEGNHGEDVKEEYYYLDSTPTHSYMKALYKYPHDKFPYGKLISENNKRGVEEPEYELVDTGIFKNNRYFDVFAEYAKADDNDTLIRITLVNRGRAKHELHVMPTLWFRNVWSWGCTHEGCSMKPNMKLIDKGLIRTDHEDLEPFDFIFDCASDGTPPEVLFTDNHTNKIHLGKDDPGMSYAKDGINEYIIKGKASAVRKDKQGTKVSPCYHLSLAPGEKITIDLRLAMTQNDGPKHFKKLGADFDKIFEKRKYEADQFYNELIPENLNEDETNVMRQSYAGLLWTKQFYHYIVEDWHNGDPYTDTPPNRWRNRDWMHLYNRDIISMPDKWEYPWYAAWDLAFHMIPFARLDPEFSKRQLVLMLREWYMHPNGQIPAYEWAFNDVNPPVHAWACYQVYKLTGSNDQQFLASVFQKLLLNFTWWVNRKDPSGNHLFSGGFLGLDNIGVFDRSQPLPWGQHLQQADGTAWMAFYCSNMLTIALELARHDRAYSDMASKFFEHFIAIAEAMNHFDGNGLWHEKDGFYYDHLHIENEDTITMRVRSMVGLIPLYAISILDSKVIDELPEFKKRMNWFLKNRKGLAKHISYLNTCNPFDRNDYKSLYLLAIPSRERLERVLQKLLDETEFLSDYGVRSLSKYHQKKPFVFHSDGHASTVEYAPGDSTTQMFGGNSNWRGPIWFPLNWLLIESLQKYDYFYQDSLMVECPTGSGKKMRLRDAAAEISKRLTRLFTQDGKQRRACHGTDKRYQNNEGWDQLVLFYEFFHGDNGRGLGASHQTGWTALVAECLRILSDPEQEADI